MTLRIGDRIGVVKGALQGYYGHVSDFVLSVPDRKLSGVGVRLKGDSLGENNPRFIGTEFFLPLDYVEHID